MDIQPNCRSQRRQIAAARRIQFPLIAGAILLYAGDVNSGIAMSDPTPAEWREWPGYCRARWREESDPRVSAAERADWKSRFSLAAWKPLHHYCAGMLKTNRAARIKDPKIRRHNLSDALTEFNYCLQRVPQTDPFFPMIASGKAETLRKLHEYAAAEQLLQQAIELAPTMARTYLVLSLIYRDQSRLQDSREILSRGVEATEGKSAEMHYFLGLINVQLGDYEAARTNAKHAYELGYPLPGLKRKLNALGHW